MPNGQKDRIVLVVDQTRFDGLMLDAGIGHRSTYQDAPAFVGSVNQLCRLMVAATEVLGPADAILLATLARTASLSGGSDFYYFPGLELS